MSDHNIVINNIIDKNEKLVDSVNKLTTTITNNVSNEIDLQKTKFTEFESAEQIKMDTFRKSVGVADNAYIKRITIEGSSDRYYPVLVRISDNTNTIRNGELLFEQTNFKYSITRNYGEDRKPTSDEYFADSGEILTSHWGQLDFSVEFSSPKIGLAQHCNIIKHKYHYKRLVGVIRHAGGNDLAGHIIWLRGKTSYNISANWDITNDFRVKCEDEIPYNIPLNRGNYSYWNTSGKMYSVFVRYVQSATISEIQKVGNLYAEGNMGSEVSTYGSITEKEALWNRNINTSVYGPPNTIGMDIAINYNTDYTSDITKLAALFPLNVNHNFAGYHHGYSAYNVTSKDTIDPEYIYDPDKEMGTDIIFDRFLLEKFNRAYPIISFPELYDECLDFNNYELLKRPDLNKPEYKHILNITDTNRTGK